MMPRSASQAAASLFMKCFEFNQFRTPWTRRVGFECEGRLVRGIDKNLALSSLSVLRMRLGYGHLFACHTLTGLAGLPLLSALVLDGIHLSLSFRRACCGIVTCELKGSWNQIKTKVWPNIR